MAESSDPSDSPQQTKRCRVCATGDPFNPSATPFTAASAAYLRLFSSQEELSLRDQGGIAPSHLSGPQTPIIFDNPIPYRQSHRNKVVNIDVRVRISRQGAGPFDPHTIIQPVAHVDKDTNTDDHQTLLIDIVEYHRHISAYDNFDDIPQDLQIPTLYSSNFCKYFRERQAVPANAACSNRAQLFSDAIRHSGIWEEHVTRRELLDEVYDTQLQKYTRPTEDQVLTNVPLQQLEGLGWYIKFVDDDTMKPHDIVWNSINLRW